MTKRKTKDTDADLKRILKFYAYLFVVWGFYRLLFQFPDPLEDLVVKPLVWVLPLYFILKKERKSFTSLGFNLNNLFHVLYSVIFLGMIFTLAAVLVNYLKYGQLLFNANLGQTPFGMAFLLSFATSISEETVFRGYIFTRVQNLLNSEWNANLITSFGWIGIHLPIAIFDWKLAAPDLAIYMLIIFSFSVGANYVFARTKNIAAPILLHVLWSWPIILFR